MIGTLLSVFYLLSFSSPFGLFFMLLDATIPDNVPVRNTTIVDIKSMKLASLGLCSAGCEINSNPKVNPMTMVLKTIASNMPTVTIMRVCSSSELYRFTATHHICRAHNMNLVSYFLLEF